MNGTSMKRLSFLVLICCCLYTVVHAHRVRKRSLQGDWTCVKTLEDRSRLSTEAVGDTGYRAHQPVGNVQIKGRMASFFDYPCQYQFTAELKRFAQVFSYSEPGGFTRYMINHEDTLIITDAPGGRFTKYYVRDTFDAAQLARLKNGIVNPACLAGQWRLIRFDDTYDGGGREYNYPFALADTLTLSTALLSREKYVLLLIDRQPHECTAEFFYDLFYEEYRIRFRVLSGSQEEFMEIVYARCDEAE